MSNQMDRWQNGFLTKTETVQSEAKSVSVRQQLTPQALAIPDQDLGRRRSMRRLSAQATLPNRVASLHRSEPNLVNGVDVEPSSSRRDMSKIYTDELDLRNLERGKYAQKLFERFSRMTEESPHPHRPFLPSSKFRQIHVSDICTALQKSRRAPVQVEDPENYRKIFFVLCLLKLPTKIRKFIKCRVRDADLPLCVADSRGFWKVLRSQDGSNTNIVKFKMRSDADDFCKRQWVVLAPKFEGCNTDEKSIPHYDLNHRHVLPFKPNFEIKREGSYGEVTRVEIFPDHHSLAVSRALDS